MSSAAEAPAVDVGHATDVRCDGGSLHLTLSTGRVVQVPIEQYAWLADVSPRLRAAVEVVDFGTAIRWPELDVDLGVASIIGVPEEAVARSAGYDVRSRRRR